MIKLVELADGVVEAADREREHAVLHELEHELGRRRVFPALLRFRIQPDGLRVGVQQALDPDGSGLFVPVLDAAAGVGDLVRSCGNRSTRGA